MFSLRQIERLKNFEIRVGCDRNLTNNPLCAIYLSKTDGEFGRGETRTINCVKDANGCVLSIHKSSQWNQLMPLTLCEVEVYGTYM